MPTRNPHAEAAVKSASGTRALIHDQLRRAARQPTETPRKHAISTMLVKNVKNMTVLPNQRMHASSKKRIDEADQEELDARAQWGRARDTAMGMSGVRGADTPALRLRTSLSTVAQYKDSTSLDIVIYVSKQASSPRSAPARFRE